MRAIAEDPSRVFSRRLDPISIAPMRAAHGVTPEKLVSAIPGSAASFSGDHGSLELESMRAIAVPRLSSRNTGP